MRNIEIPKNVYFIDNYAFKSCTGLVKINLPDSISIIGWKVFDGCTNLTEIVLPDKDEEITMSIDAFQNTGWYDSQADGILYINDYCLGIKNTVQNGEVNIKDGTKYICVSAFYNNEQIKSVVIPNSVISIGVQAFLICKNLKYFSFGEGLQTIKGTPFDYCSSMEYIVGEAVTPPVCENYSYVFNDIDKTICKLYVPKESIAAYKVANGWKDFFNINELSGITDVMDTENIRVLSRDGEILVLGVENSVNVEIYDINGACVYSGSDTVIPVNGKGIYVVVVNGKAHKVLL